MSTLLGVIGLTTMFAGLILFILTFFTEISKKIAAYIGIVGFVLLSLSDFPQDALFGIFGLLAMIVGIVILIISAVNKKSLKAPGIVILIGFLAFSSSISTQTGPARVQDATVLEPTEVEASESGNQKTVKKLEEKNKELASKVVALESKNKEAEKRIEELEAKVKEAEPFFLLEEKERKAKEAELKKKEEEEKAEKAAEEEAAKEKAEAEAKAKEEVEAKKAADEKAAAEEEERMGYDTGITYDQLARTPDEFIFEKVKFSGTVVQVMEGDGLTQIRLAVNDDYDHILFAEFDASLVDSRILEDDTITIRGISSGLITYESTMGGSISIPGIVIDQIDQ
ncbi:toxin regulator [Metaplanococcus flavidus]|uniref:Toxin regulator n=1 Tax=Metaplanococcus flavidus TaxID=569883 RepID=A0ABW3L783_9BACL